MICSVQYFDVALGDWCCCGGGQNYDATRRDDIFTRSVSIHSIKRGHRRQHLPVPIYRLLYQNYISNLYLINRSQFCDFLLTRFTRWLSILIHMFQLVTWESPLHSNRQICYFRSSPAGCLFELRIGCCVFLSLCHFPFWWQFLDRNSHQTLRLH